MNGVKKITLLGWFNNSIGELLLRRIEQEQQQQQQHKKVDQQFSTQATHIQKKNLLQIM